MTEKHVGTVTATFSRRMQVALDDGAVVGARIKGRRLKPVCGDQVEVEPIPQESDWLITAIRARQTALTRPNTRGDIEFLAANFDLLVVVAAARPKPDWFIVDRYLGAAELSGADAVLIMNKSDIPHTQHAEALAVFAQLGYGAILTSCETGDGITTLEDRLRDHVSVIVGQSGVGKSSLVNCLVDGDRQRIADISEKHKEGRHTTVNSAMRALRAGGSVIDSPGVRDFAPGLTAETDVEHGFIEIRRAAEDCKFANCKHLAEPGCAVKAAAESEQISPRRLESYRRLLRLKNDLTRGRY